MDESNTIVKIVPGQEAIVTFNTDAPNCTEWNEEIGMYCIFDVNVDKLLIAGSDMVETLQCNKPLGGKTLYIWESDPIDVHDFNTPRYMSIDMADEPELLHAAMGHLQKSL